MQSDTKPLFHPPASAADQKHYDAIADNHLKGNPLATQVGGDHYKDLKIQPVEYIHANGIAFIEGSVIKYVTRWREKGGVKDLEKARHFIDILIALESAK